MSEEANKPDTSKQTKESKKKESKMDYVNGNLEEYEIKTLLQDIETSGYDVEDINLDILSKKNPEYYGTARNEKYRIRRQLISSKLQDLKRKTSSKYLMYVKGYSVTPSPFTVENAANAATAATPTPKKKQRVTPPPEVDDDTEMADMFHSFGINDSNSFENSEAFPPPPPRSFTPPRIPKHVKSPPMSSFGTTKLKSPDHTPSRSSMPTSRTATSSVSHFTMHSHSDPVVFGSYEKPWKIDIVPGFSGRYINNIWIYEETKQVKDGQKKHSYSGYLFMTKVDPPDVTLHSCFVADTEYIELLYSNNIITWQEKSCCFVVFRGPMVEAFDRVGLDGIIQHQWISEESKEKAQMVHANIKPGVDSDESPGPSWVYTVAKVPPEHNLDNRVFSDHDHNVSPYESMPNRAKVAELANEEVLAFHIQWRVAIKGTEQLMDETKKMSLAERMKKRRDQHKNP